MIYIYTYTTVVVNLFGFTAPIDFEIKYTAPIRTFKFYLNSIYFKIDEIRGESLSTYLIVSSNRNMLFLDIANTVIDGRSVSHTQHVICIGARKCYF
jgi:hypothetical protein